MRRRIFQMTPSEEVAVLSPRATIQAAAVAMKERRRCVVLVMTGDRLDGILTEQDIVRRAVADRLDPDATTVAQVMTPHPDTIDRGSLALCGLQMMEDGGYRHLPVVWEGRVVGLVSRIDFLGEEKAELERQRHFQEGLR